MYSIPFRAATFMFFIILAKWLHAQDQPNFLWIVCEDISPTLSMYGDSTAKTPNLENLAADGVVYDLAFAPVGVCAPARSAIITGMYPTRIGTMHMRTARDVFSWGRREYAHQVPIADIAGDTIRQYAAVTPEYVKCFTEYLREAGYYCTNNRKTDYQFAAPVTAWDENGNRAHWRNRPQGMPFFSVINIGTTHESRLWRNRDLPLTIDPEMVPVPPYLPDHDTTRRDIARHYSNVERMDAEVGDIIRDLKADGLYENTIIFFYSDHGGPLPRQKRAIYDSGLRVPFIVKPVEAVEDSRTDRMISFVDLAPTMMSLAGMRPPGYMNGKAFLGPFAEKPRAFVLGSSDRFDDFTDRSRAVRDHRFLYIRNFFPGLPKYKDVRYRKQIPMMQVMLEMEGAGMLDSVQSAWFRSKPEEELYDCLHDPHNIRNIAGDSQFVQILDRMRTRLREHLHRYPDWGQIPESEMIDIMWPDGKQPVTEMPEVDVEDGHIHLNCPTKGASIAYVVSQKPILNIDLNIGWRLYTRPFPMQSGEILYAISERIGYRESEIRYFAYRP